MQKKEDLSTEEDSPKPDDEVDQNDVLDQWPELQRLLNGESVEALFEKGWKPLIKPKPNGKQYMAFRFHGKDEDGNFIDTERGLGSVNAENPERWNILKALYDEFKESTQQSQQLPSIPLKINNPQSTSTRTPQNRSSILTTKMGRLAPIGPSVQIKLGTLQWFTWIQQAAGYSGTLDDFINESVETLFREYYKLELAVIMQGD